MLRFSQIAAPAALGLSLLLTGCANDQREIPPTARMVTEGTTNVTATAPHDGTVYVFDDTSNKMVYIGKVDKGDTVSVDAKDDQVLLGAKPAVQRELWDTHRYQVYFDESNAALGDDATVVRHRSDGSTIIQNGDHKTTVVTPGDKDTVIRSDGTVVKPDDSDKTVIRKKETVIEH
jgi:hypothetical protein